MPGDHVDLLDISVGKDAGLPALDVANHSNPVPAVRRHLPWDHVDLPDISVGEDSGLPEFYVANHSNPLPDLRRQGLQRKVKAMHDGKHRTVTS